MRRRPSTERTKEKSKCPFLDLENSCNFLRRVKEFNVILLSPRIEGFSFLSKSSKTLQDLLFNPSFLTQTLLPPGVWDPIKEGSSSQSKKNENDIKQFLLEIISEWKNYLVKTYFD